ncbi:hypothetical protein ISS42_01605 [Candidatus Shapirobacteria bacterium]|nr:hypothetical protein [Candidatus Shapirobacteria bacterium]
MSKKGFLLLVVLGILLRLLLAASTLHPDLASIISSSSLLYREKVLNIYDYLQNAPDNNLVVQSYGRRFFTYPPLAYFLLGGLGFLFSPFVGKEVFIKLLSGPVAFAGLGFNLSLLALKLPYLIFDLLVLFFLRKMFSDEKKRFWVSLLWWFNPVAIYASYMVAQFEIIPLFFVIFSLWAHLAGLGILGVVLLGLGAGLKMFPLFFLLPLAFLSFKTVFNRLKAIVIGIGVYLLTILPFSTSSAFRENVLFSNQSQKMFFAQLPVSGAEGIYIFIFLFCLICYYAFYDKNIIHLSNYYLFILLAFFSVTHFHPQWFLWVTPFLIINLVESKMQTWPMAIMMLFSWLGITLLFEPSLSIGLFAPLSKNLLQAKGLVGVMPLAFDAFMVKSILRSIFAASSLFLVIFSFKDE